MDFYQHIQANAFGHGRQLSHLHVIQCRDDQQHAVGAQGTGLDNLVRVNHEILADHWQLARRAGLLQEQVAALEEVDIGQYRQAGCAALLVALGNVFRIKELADHALAG